MHINKRKYIIKPLKVMGWFVGIVLFLLIALILSLRIPWVQNVVKNKAVNFYKKKTGSEMTLGRLYVNFPSSLELQDLYLEDQKGDTLVFCHDLEADADLFGLLKNELKISEIRVNKLVASVYNTNTDSLFNYQFIIDSFVNADSVETSAADSTSAGFDFSIYGAQVTESRIHYLDVFNGMEAKAQIGDLLVEASEFDLNKSLIDISYLNLKNTKGSFVISKNNESSTDTTSAPFQLHGKSAGLENVNFSFEDKPGGMRVVTDIGLAQIDINTLDIIDQQYLADNFQLSNSYISVDLFNQNQNNDSLSNEVSSPISLKAGSDRLGIKNLDLRFNDHSAQPSVGFNPLNFWIRNFNLETQHIVFEDGYADGEINHLSFSEDHGFTLKNFQGVFAYQETESFIQNLKASTNGSSLEGDIRITYPNLDKIADQFHVDADLSPSRVSTEDINYFAPGILDKIPVQMKKNQDIRFQGSIAGDLDNLSINNLKVALNNSRLATTASIRNLRDIPNLSANVPQFTFLTTSKELRALLPNTLLPTSINLPDTMQLKASVNGSLKKGKGKMTLNTSLGNIKTSFDVNQSMDSIYHYTLEAGTEDLEAGTILGQSSLGSLDLSLNVRGNGIEPDSMSGKAEGIIKRVVYNEYEYKDINMRVDLNHGDLDAYVNLDDKNISFDFKGHTVLIDTARQYVANLNVKGIDLEALHLSPVNYKFSAHLNANLTASSVDDINGGLYVKDIIISREDVFYQNDSLAFLAKSSNDSINYHLFSGFLDADLSGKFKPSQLPATLLSHLNHYYHLRDLDTLNSKNLSDQSFEFTMKIKDPEMLRTVFLPDIQQLASGNVKGSFNSADSKLHVEMAIFSMIYAGVGVDSVNVRIDSDEDSLNYSFALSSIYTSGINVANIELYGKVSDNKMLTNLHVQDNEDKDQYFIGGEFQSLKDQQLFRFLSKKFMLNYHKWSVNENNAIRFYDSGTWFDDVFFKYNQQELKIHSKLNQQKDTVLLVELIKLNLEDLGKIVKDSSALVAGIVNGFVELNLLDKGGLAFKSDSRIDNLAIKGDTLGVLALEGLSDDGLNYNVDLEVKGRGNRVRLSGDYTADSLQSLDLDLDLSRLNLSSIDAITASQVQNMKGYLTGHVDIDGTTSDPSIDGNLRFNKTAFTSTYLNSRFQIDQEQLKVNNNGIRFNDFVIQDKSENEAVINGTVKSTDLTVFDLDLTVKTRDFLLLDRKIPDNFTSNSENLLYGQLKLNSDISVKGNSLQPKIRMDVSFGDGSTFAYVIPESTVSEQVQKDVVEWFDEDIEENAFFKDVSMKTDTLSSTFQGIDLVANVSVNETNTLSVVIDPVTGDMLSVSGDADLTYGIKPSGDMTLTGRFEVSKGSYHMNFYNLVKREFDIQEGSYILWTGDPFSAQMKITAEYDVKAAPVGLEDFHSKLDFIVFLDIGGQLLKPDISFRLGLAENARAPLQVETWVQQKNGQPEDVNKQAFGLLMFKSFFPDDPLSGTGNSNLAEATARNSVSRMLSAQLSKLSDKINGVELSIDLDSYEDYNSKGETYGRTQLELGLSKDFFNDRVVVKVAGNFDLEGQDQSTRGMSDFAGDIRIEYKLTEDGRYRLVGFSENAYDNLQGDIVRTGVGFIFVREYDAFRELFKKPESEKVAPEKKKKQNKNQPEEDQ